MKVKIAIIDTGINKELFTKGIAYKYINLEEINNSEEDLIGHGSAVVYLLENYSISNNFYYIINIFDKNGLSTEKNLIKALEYIQENLDVDIVHISSGIVRPSYENELKEVIDKMYEKGTIIISAFDNTGSQSYPACLDNVIGVDISEKCANINEYILVKNSTVNILSTYSEFYVPWKNGKFRLVQGTSFSAPIITGKIVDIYYKGISYNEIYDKLKDKALKIEIQESGTVKNKYNLNIKNAVIFPVNKETHAIIGNLDKIKFNIVDIYDYPFSVNIGRYPEEFIFGVKKSNIRIKSIKKFEDSMFDTFILGHTELMSKIYHIDFIKIILELCIKYKKNIYSFDNLSEYKQHLEKIRDNGNDYYYYENNKIKVNDYGKLYRMTSPVLGICGTSPQQGKFNVQLDLRDKFIKDGYQIRQLGTEPSSFLFDMDYIYHNGYGTSISMSNNEEIFMLNKIFKDMDDKDIIIFGTQSNIINYSFGNLGFYTHSQVNILIASEPDAIVLCANITDELDYVIETIIFLEKIMKTNVISIMLFQQKKEHYIQNVFSIKNLDVKEKVGMHRKYIVNNGRKIPIFINGNKECMLENYKLIINYFGGCDDKI